MPPHISSGANGQPKFDEVIYKKLVAPQATPWKWEVVFVSVAQFGIAHLLALYGLYLACTIATWKTMMLNFIIYIISNIGITAGAHRLWSHKAYKAKLPLQILLMIMASFAGQNSVTHWVRDHRMHHRFCDTDADPHNSTRGFFFCHIGWLLARKHPEVKIRKDLIDMSDIHTNPVLKFQRIYGVPLIGTITFIIPTVIPMLFFGETLNTAWHIGILRWVFSLHAIFMINSAAHLWGTKPYDKTINPSQNIPATIVSLGEGFHNYHHVYPWDYKAAELGNNMLNMTTLFINFFAWIGWAYDLKSASNDVIVARAKRTGDGSSSWGFRK